MGTEVLTPHDVLSSRRLGSSPSTAAAAFLPRRRPTPTSCPSNPRLQRRPEPRKRREGSPRTAKNSGGSYGSLEMGQVTILRRGEALDSKPGGGLRVKAKEERHGEAGAAGDVIVLGTGRIEPQPAVVPKQVRFAEVKAGRAETYAGPAFSMSPSPRALPLPTFSSRKAAEGGGPVDLCATRDLRRLLRLD